MNLGTLGHRYYGSQGGVRCTCGAWIITPRTDRLRCALGIPHNSDQCDAEENQ